MDYKTLKKRLLSIPNQEHQALFCTIYACMARVGEIVRGRVNKTRGLEVEDGCSFKNKLELHLRTEKTGKPRKVILFRNREAWLIDIIEAWARHKGSGELFPFSTSWAEKLFKRYFPEISSNRGGDKMGSKHTVHWLRGWRYTHYRRGNVTGKKVESVVASKIGGWVSSATPERCYDFTSIEDFEKELENS